MRFRRGPTTTHRVSAWDESRPQQGAEFHTEQSGGFHNNILIWAPARIADVRVPGAEDQSPMTHIIWLIQTSLEPE